MFSRGFQLTRYHTRGATAHAHRIVATPPILQTIHISSHLRKDPGAQFRDMTCTALHCSFYSLYTTTLTLSVVLLFLLVFIAILVILVSLSHYDFSLGSSRVGFCRELTSAGDRDRASAVNALKLVCRPFCQSPNPPFLLRSPEPPSFVMLLYLPPKP